ncbi:MAG: type III pantothenate kinase [Dissulfurispiraceae bacterium]
MLIAVNIGNSNIGFGLFPDPLHSTSLIVRKVPTHPARTSGFYKKIISQMIKETHTENIPRSISAIVASVVPARNAAINKPLASFCRKRPLYVSAGTNSGLTFSVKEPFKLGADRIANAVAGINCNKGRPTAVLDFGSATTITVVGKKSALLGGAISPGIYLMLKALNSGTAKLPLVSTDALEKALGTDTASSIISGIVYGTAGAVEKLIIMMEKELKIKLQLVLTGGNAPLVSSFINRAFIHRPHLTFEGLRLIYLKN